MRTYYVIYHNLKLVACARSMGEADECIDNIIIHNDVKEGEAFTFHKVEEAI